jgi:hypothetical protein
VIDMVETIFTEEDRKHLRTLAEEVPKLRILIEEFLETLDVLSDEQLLKSIRLSEEDVREGRLLTFKQLVKKLGLDEKEI